MTLDTVCGVSCTIVQVIDTNPMMTNFNQLELDNIGHVLGCLVGVWRMSRWCLKTSGKCLGGKNVKQVENSQVRVMIISWCCFFQWPIAGQKSCILVCLWGVCWVSGGCLEGFLVLLDDVEGILIKAPNLIF